MTKSKNHPSPLLRLPPELRLEIYAHVITITTPAQLDNNGKMPPVDRSIPAILEVCRIIRHEARPIYGQLLRELDAQADQLRSKLERSRLKTAKEYAESGGDWLYICLDVTDNYLQSVRGYKESLLKVIEFHGL